MRRKFVSAACLAALTLPNCAAADECPPHHCKLPKDDAALEAFFASSETSSYSEHAYFDEIPLVLSASRVAQSPLDAPAPVTVIDRETIRASGFNEVHDLLRLVPGFLIADLPDGPPIVVNHGLGDARGRRLQVLIDGRSIYNPFSGAVDWQSLPIRPDDIERIEVVRGPNPATYGANAFQGVVNIITRSPHSEEGVQALFSAGKPGINEAALRLNGRAGAASWRVAVSHRAVTNFRDFGETPFNLGEKIRRDLINAQFAVQLSAQDDLRFQFGAVTGQDPVGGVAQSDYPPHRRDNRSAFFQAGWRRSTAPDAEMSVQYYHFHNSENDPFSVTGQSGQIIPLNKNLEMQRDDLEFQQTLPLQADLRALWGAGVRRDQVRSDHYLAGQGDVGGTQWQVFGNLVWQAAPQWQINLGGMVEKHYFTETLLSPRLAANYALTPHHSLRAGAGRGYRAPTAFEEKSRELYPYRQTVADVGYRSYQHLQAEQVNFREIGYVGQFPEYGVRLDARLFREDYRNYIDDQSCQLGGGTPACPFAPPPGYQHILGSTKAYIFLNSGAIRSWGEELQLDWRNTWLGRLLLGYSRTYIDAEAGVDKDVPRSAPRDMLSLLWSRNFAGRYAAGLGYYYVGDMMWLNDGDFQRAYRRVDLRLARRFGKPGGGDEIAVTLQNLGGAYPQFSNGDFVAERRAFVTLRLSWN